MTDNATTPVTETLNQLIGVYWTALAQHQTHVALLRSWGIAGLAANMEARIADEPVTLRSLTDRLLDLDGAPAFTIGAPNIGTTLREVLANDMEAQRQARPALNHAAEQAGAEHDATTRILIEGILADEELHLSWLRTEIDLLDRIGESLYVASRLGSAPATPVA